MPMEPVFGHNPMVLKGAAQENAALDKLFRVLLKVVHEIPVSAETETANALARARRLTAVACVKAAAISGSLALPPSPFGWLTILPDLAAIWRLQAQLVADIGAVFGKEGKLTEQSMIYCLFKHASAQIMRDVVTRMGERIIVNRVSFRVTENVLEGIGIRIIQRVARRGLWRLLPILGAVAVAGYAYYDTEQVGQNAIEFFSKNVELA